MSTTPTRRALATAWIAVTLLAAWAPELAPVVAAAPDSPAPCSSPARW